MTTAHTSNQMQKLFISTKPKHPRQIKENIPKMIKKRTSKLTKNKVSFDNEKHIYQNALNKNNFNYKLEYNSTIDNIKLKNRKKKMHFLQPTFLRISENKIWKTIPKTAGQTFPEIN